MAGKIVEAIVVTLCLPVYIVLWPIDAISVAWKVRTLSKRKCPLCGAQMDGLERTDFRFVAVRFVLAAGTKVQWDRLPHDEVRCPRCDATFCIDRKWRFTSCNHGDHMTRDPDVPRMRLEKERRQSS